MKISIRFCYYRICEMYSWYKCCKVLAAEVKRLYGLMPKLHTENTCSSAMEKLYFDVWERIN